MTGQNYQADSVKRGWLPFRKICVYLICRPGEGGFTALPATMVHWSNDNDHHCNVLWHYIFENYSLSLFPTAYHASISTYVYCDLKILCFFSFCKRFTETCKMTWGHWSLRTSFGMYGNVADRVYCNSSTAASSRINPPIFTAFLAARWRPYIHYLNKSTINKQKYHPHAKLQLHDKFQLRAFSSFSATVMTKIALLPGHPPTTHTTPLAHLMHREP